MSSTGSLKQKVRQFIDEIRIIPGVDESALVSIDGILIGTTFEDKLSAQSFGAMCATMLASSEAAASIVTIPTPSSVVVKGESRTIIVSTAGSRLLIAVIVDEGADLDAISAALREVGGRIGGTL